MSQKRQIVMVYILGVLVTVPALRLYAEMCKEPYEYTCITFDCIPYYAPYEVTGDNETDCFCTSTTEYVNCEEIEKSWACETWWDCTDDCSSCSDYFHTEWMTFCGTD